MDGLTCVERIRKACADVRIVMLSAADEPERAEEAFARGADVYLSKSVDPRELPDALRRAHRGERFQLATMDATEQLDERAGLTDARARGPRGGRAWSREPGDQLGALDHRADREVPLDEHLSQARRQQPHRGGALRVQPRHRRGLTATRFPAASGRSPRGRSSDRLAARELERSAEQADSLAHPDESEPSCLCRLVADAVDVEALPIVGDRSAQLRPVGFDDDGRALGAAVADDVREASCTTRRSAIRCEGVQPSTFPSTSTVTASPCAAASLTSSRKSSANGRPTSARGVHRPREVPNVPLDRSEQSERVVDPRPDDVEREPRRSEREAAGGPRRALRTPAAARRGGRIPGARRVALPPRPPCAPGRARARGAARARPAERPRPPTPTRTRARARRGPGALRKQARRESVPRMTTGTK